MSYFSSLDSTSHDDFQYSSASSVEIVKHVCPCIPRTPNAVQITALEAGTARSLYVIPLSHHSIDLTLGVEGV